MTYSTEIVELPIEQITIKNRYQALNLDVVDQLKTSIEEVGLKNPITITREGVLVAGLHRLTALGKLGYKKVPVIYTEVDPDKNDMEQIDENLVRQTLLFPERAQQTFRRMELSIKALKNLDDADSEKMRAYLDDKQTYGSLIKKLKVRENDYQNYKQVILNLDPDVLEFLKQLHLEKKYKINTATYLTLSKLPKEWQYRLVNVVEEKKQHPNTAAANLEIEYNKHLTNLRMEEIRRKEQEEARRREEERIRKLEEDRKKQEELFRKQEEERRKREEEAAKQRQLLLEKMKRAKEEEERLALLRRQEELERQEKQRRLEEERKAKLERERLEKLRKKQEEERKKNLEAEEKRIRELEEKKKIDEYVKLHNTRPPRLKDAKTSKNIIEVIKDEEPKIKHRVIHFSETFNLSVEAGQANYRTWIDSESDIYCSCGKNRIQEAIQKHEKVLFVCYNQTDILKVVKEIEKFS